MNTLNLKKNAELEKGVTYSICLRGARHIEKDPSIFYDLSITTEYAKYNAIIVSQAHFKFSDITDEQCGNNYDLDVKNKETLLEAMINAYGEDFNPLEIVTLLTFEVR